MSINASIYAPFGTITELPDKPEATPEARLPGATRRSSRPFRSRSRAKMVSG